MGFFDWLNQGEQEQTRNAYGATRNDVLTSLSKGETNPSQHSSYELSKLGITGDDVNKAWEPARDQLRKSLSLGEIDINEAVRRGLSREEAGSYYRKSQTQENAEWREGKRRAGVNAVNDAAQTLRDFDGFKELAGKVEAKFGEMLTEFRTNWQNTLADWNDTSAAAATSTVTGIRDAQRQQESEFAAQAESMGIPKDQIAGQIRRMRIATNGEVGRVLGDFQVKNNEARSAINLQHSAMFTQLATTGIGALTSALETGTLNQAELERRIAELETLRGQIEMGYYDDLIADAQFEDMLAMAVGELVNA